MTVVARLTPLINGHPFGSEILFGDKSPASCWIDALVGICLHATVKEDKGVSDRRVSQRGVFSKRGGCNNRVPQDRGGTCTFFPHLSVRLYEVVVVAQEM